MPQAANEEGQVRTTEIEPAFAAKAQDLEALRNTVVDAATVGAGLWLSYLFVLFYLLIAAGGVTHRDLFLESAVKLPFLNVDLPLTGFFVVGPGLFLIVHAYVLIHFVLLADKVGVFDDELQTQVKDGRIRTRLRRQLPSNIFVQILAGPKEVRTGVLGFMLRQIAQISLVIAPVGLLVFFQLQFLPYHSEAISWWQRTAVVADLILLWMLWPSVARGQSIGRAWHAFRSRRGKVLSIGFASAVPIVLVFTIATFPGELLDRLPSIRLVPWKVGKNNAWRFVSLQELLVAGEVDFSTRRATSLWSNRLVLPGIDVIDHSKFDSEIKIAGMPTSVSLRARHLEGAVLIGSTLRKADFTGAWMQGAKLGSSDLREAKFECDATRDEGPKGPEQRCAQLQGSSFVGSSLEGASFVNAQLDGALFYRAQLEAASFIGAQLNGAALDSAQLQGASLDSAHLEGASLVSTKLQGATLDYAILNGASLDGAQLQGATFNMTELQWASLRGVFAWRTDARNAIKNGARVEAESGAKETCLELRQNITSDDKCDWSVGSFARLNKLILETVPPSPLQIAAITRVRRLDPSEQLEDEKQMSGIWPTLKTSSPSLADYERGLAQQWRKVGCLSSYVLRGMVARIKGNDGTFDAHGEALRNLAVNLLDVKTCAVAGALSEDDRAVLNAIRGSTASGPHNP